MWNESMRNDKLPDGWIHSGATHCTHVPTQAAVWGGRPDWCYQRHQPLGCTIKMDGTAATRAEAMRLVLSPVYLLEVVSKLGFTLKVTSDDGEDRYVVYDERTNREACLRVPHSMERTIREDILHGFTRNIEAQREPRPPV